MPIEMMAVSPLFFLNLMLKSCMAVFYIYESICIFFMMLFLEDDSLLSPVFLFFPPPLYIKLQATHFSFFPL